MAELNTQKISELAIQSTPVFSTFPVKQQMNTDLYQRCPGCQKICWKRDFLEGEVDCRTCVSGKKFRECRPPDRQPKSKSVNKPKRKSKKQKRKERQQKQQQPPAPAPFRWVPYAEYLCSKWWKQRRKQKIKNAGGKCERCGGREELQVHHLHYKSLGREKDKDLQVVCRPCHELEHSGLIAANNHLDAIVGR